MTAGYQEPHLARQGIAHWPGNRGCRSSAGKAGATEWARRERMPKSVLRARNPEGNKFSYRMVEERQEGRGGMVGSV